MFARYRLDIFACIVVTAGVAGLGMLQHWGIATIALATVIGGLGFGYPLVALRQSAARNRLYVRDHGNQLLRQAEFAMELRRMLEPRALLPASRGWAACPDLLATICDLVQQHQPKIMLECGAGLSTITSSLALERFGAAGAKLVTLEHDAAWAEESRRRLVQHGLDRIATIHHTSLAMNDVAGESRQWYDLRSVTLPERIDFLVIDGPPAESSAMSRFPAGPMLHERLAPGAIIVLDDADRPDEQAAVARWIAELGWERVAQVTSTEKGIAVLRRP
jgi:predicted O-methyltransferase YrrM